MGRLNWSVISKHNHLAIDFAELRLARPDFEESIVKLRKKLGIRPELFLSDSPEYNDELSNYLDISDDHISELLSKHKLSKHWFQVVFFYLISNGSLNQTNVMTENQHGLVITEENLEYPGITLHIGPDTTYTEYISAWKMIKEKRGKKLKINKCRENAARDLRLFTLHKQGRTLSEIYKIIKEEYGDDLDYGNIKKVISETYDRCHTPKEMRDKQKTK